MIRGTCKHVFTGRELLAVTRRSGMGGTVSGTTLLNNVCGIRAHNNKNLGHLVNKDELF